MLHYFTIHTKCGHSFELYSFCLPIIVSFLWSNMFIFGDIKTELIWIISWNMDSKHVKIDKNQQIEKLKKIPPPFRIFGVSHYNTMPGSTSFCHNASHITKILYLRLTLSHQLIRLTLSDQKCIHFCIIYMFTCYKISNLMIEIVLIIIQFLHKFHVCYKKSNTSCVTKTTYVAFQFINTSENINLQVKHGCS